MYRKSWGLRGKFDFDEVSISADVFNCVNTLRHVLWTVSGICFVIVLGGGFKYCLCSPLGKGLPTGDWKESV